MSDYILRIANVEFYGLPYLRYMFYTFLEGFRIVGDAFLAYKLFIVIETINDNRFWFNLNKEWLFMNYEPEEMFILGLI